MNKLLTLALASICICNIAFARNEVVTTASPKPLQFIENRGQITDQYYQPRHDIDFKLNATGGLNVFIGAGAIHYQFSKVDSVSIKRLKIKSPTNRFMENEPDETESIDYIMYRMDVELIGANKDAVVITEDKQDYYENYYTPGVGTNGATVHGYKKITYKNIYPSVDWVIYTPPAPVNGNDHNYGMKYDFVVHQGADPTRIQLKYSGATKLVLNEDGSLTTTTPMGIITEQSPVSYQADGTPVTSRFVLNRNILSYAVGVYTGNLVIDPSLDWGTYYGGGSVDDGTGITTNKSGNVIVTGYTSSSNNIATTGAHRTTFTTSGGSEAFLTKLTNKGARLWSTYYGPSIYEGQSTAIDDSGNIYMSGYTDSYIGIATIGAHDVSFQGGYDAYLVKFDSSGLRQWGTYYGGVRLDYGRDIAIDKSGNVYLVGSTLSLNDISSTGSYQETHGSGSGYYNSFLVKFNSAGVRQWGTYYGSTLENTGWYVTTDNSNNVFISGWTTSTTGIATNGTHQATYGGGLRDAYLVKFDSNGVRKWGTYFGGSGDDLGRGISTDSVGNIYMAGETKSTNGIATSGAYQTVFGGGVYDAYLAKFDTSGKLKWGTYCGGNAEDIAYGIAVDTLMSIYLSGKTSSTNSISTAGAYQITYGGGGSDAFLVKYNDSGTKIWGTYFGGSGEDFAKSVSSKGAGSVYLTGTTNSTSAIATNNTHQSSIGGLRDAFVAKFCDVSPNLDTLSGPINICVGDTAIINHNLPGGTFISKSGKVSIDSAGRLKALIAGADTILYVIMNTCGSDTAAHAITILPQILINSQPSDYAVHAGGNSIFTINATGTGLTYQWQANSGSGFQNVSNGVQYSGATTDVLIVNNTTGANHNQKFRCVVSTSSCTDTSDSATLYVWPLSVHEVQEKGIRIFPNPASDAFIITSSSTIHKAEVRNLLGQVVLTKNGTSGKMEINIGNLSPGVYVIRVNDAYTEKLVKK